MNLISDIFIPLQVLGQMPAPNSPHIDFSDLVAIIIIPALCLLIGWLAWVMNRVSHLKAKAQVELQTRLLEKINSAQDVAQLTQSEEGRQFIEAFFVKQPALMEEILGSVRKGIICTAVGLGGLLLRWIFPMGFGVFIIASILTGAIGVGFLISSAITYRLSKSWGLISKSR
ncbi:MAG TPA: hypothetical protein VLR90_17160 [Blastocatellia bacterium]|nr:hypothetical protein [Blastocatellia bacterium]